MLFGLIPFVIYFIGRNFLDYDTLKYTVIASSLPVIQAYVIWGTELVFIPYFLFLSIFILIIVVPKVKSRLLYLLLAVLAISLLTSHAVTSFLVSMLLPSFFVSLIMYRYLRKKNSHHRI